jgi:uncharacterized protein (DUF952 family)
MIYHIASRAAWADAQKRKQYRATSLESEGFIHCSARKQALEVANALYRGQTDLLLLCIDENKLSSELRWEAPAHPKASMAEQAEEGSPFPHLYGVLNLDAVVAVHKLNERASGFVLPPDLP